MPRTPVVPKDLVSLVVTALNGATCNGGTLSAKANGSEILVVVHNDAPGTFPTQYAIYVH